MTYGTHHLRCAAINCRASSALIISDVPLCDHHRARLTATLSGKQAPAPVSEYRSIVYYVTWDKGETVKIGTTTDPKSRLNSYHSRAGRPVDLLVAHPGSYDEEKVNHHRFRHLRLPNEREVFRQGRDLVDHIANVKMAWPNWKQIVNEVAWQRAGKRGRPLYAVLNAV